ncbi:hypothetical protein TNCV_3124121 [Trichonephila clavipes]|nr:hypothetical protein TNCV_3124121 [Trichonephila clavipes]
MEKEVDVLGVDEDDVETVDTEDEVLGIGFAEDTGFRHCKGARKLHPRVPPPTTKSTREAVCRSSGKTRHGAYLSTPRIVIQHQGEDPTLYTCQPLSAELTLQQCSPRTPKRVITSRLTGAAHLATRLQRSEGLVFPDTICLLTDAAHGKHAVGYQRC